MSSQEEAVRKKGGKRKASQPAVEEGLEDKRRRELEQQETARLRDLALQSGLQRKRQLPPNLVNEDLSLPIGAGLRRCDGGHIKSRKLDKRRRYLLSFPGSMRIKSSVTGQLGTIEGLDTACPSVILDCGSGRILLRGVVVPTKGRLLNLQAKTTGTDPRDLIVTDQFEYLIVLSEYTWVGTAEANPELNPLPFPDGVLEADDQTIDVQEESDTEQSQTTSQSQSQSRRQSASQSLENGMSPTLEEREEEEASWQEQESNHEGKEEEEEALQALRRPRRSTAGAKKYIEVESDEELMLEEEEEEEEEGEGGEEQDQQQAKEEEEEEEEEEEFAPPKSKALALAGKKPSSSARKTPARKPNSKQLAPGSSDEEVVVLGDSSSQAEEMEDEGRERLAATALSRPRRVSAAGPKKYKVELSSEEEEEEEDNNHEEQKDKPTIAARNLQRTMPTSATKRPRRETKPKNYKEDNSGGSASSEGDDIPFAQKAPTKKKNATSSPHPAAKPVKSPAAAKPVAAAKSTSSTWSPIAPKGRSAKIQGKGDSASILDAFAFQKSAAARTPKAASGSSKKRLIIDSEDSE